MLPCAEIIIGCSYCQIWDSSVWKATSADDGIFFSSRLMLAGIWDDAMELKVDAEAHGRRDEL